MQTATIKSTTKRTIGALRQLLIAWISAPMPRLRACTHCAGDIGSSQKTPTQNTHNANILGKSPSIQRLNPPVEGEKLNCVCSKFASFTRNKIRDDRNLAWKLVTETMCCTNHELVKRNTVLMLRKIDRNERHASDIDLRQKTQAAWSLAASVPEI